MQEIWFGKKASYGCSLGCWVGHFKVGLLVGCFLMWGANLPWCIGKTFVVGV